jgi:hypothetical protein
MSCKHARKKFVEVELGLARPALRAALEAHLAGCPACASWAAGERGLTADLALLQSEHPFTVDVSTRVAARVARLEPGAREPIGVPQLAWTSVLVVACGFGLLAGLWRIAPGLPGLVGEVRALAAGMWHALGGLAAPAAALAGTLAKSLGGLLATVGPLLATLKPLQPVVITTITLCAALMATSIVLVVGRDFRRPRWVGEESR